MSAGATQHAKPAAEAKPQLPSAKEVMERLALLEAQKASDKAKAKQAAEAEKKALIEKLQMPSGVSDEEALRRVAAIVERAVSNGLTEVQVFRFPNDYSTDHGRNHSGRTWVGEHPHRPAERDVRVLGTRAPPPWLQSPRRSTRVAGRLPGRHRYHAAMGVRAGLVDSLTRRSN